MLDLPHMLAWLDFAGVGLFALTGALVAARAQQDIVTGIFFAVFTGVGGGTVRDLLIAAPVFWIEHRGYLEVCLLAAIVVFLLDTKHWPSKALTWLDALGLSVYCVIGTIKALSYGVSPVAAAAMGVITASVGGIMRDVVAMRPSVLLDREFYITAAIAGASLTVGLIGLGFPDLFAGTIGGIAAFIVRGGTILFGWQQKAKK